MFARSRIALLLAMAVSATTLFAQDPEKKDQPHELKLTTERVIIFKDGYCLFIKQGTGTTDAAGELFTENVPDAAVLGSFWAVPKEGRLVSMTAGTVTTTEEEKKDVICTAHLDILQANLGREVTVELGNDQILSGKIGKVLAEESATAAPANLIAEHLALDLRAISARPLPASTTISTLSGSLFVLQTGDGDVLIPIGQISRLRTKELKTTREKTFKTTRTTKRLTFRFDKANAAQNVSLMYFVPGIRWIPTYRAMLPDEKAAQREAQLALQAELLNEAEDLIDVPLDLVVGVPNFRFKNTISPFSLEATLRNALAQAAPQLMGQSNSMSNAMFTQRIAEVRRPANPAPANVGDIALPPELTAAGSQDLFLYHLPKLTLKKGHRAAVPIFSAAVASRDIYSWDLRLMRNDNAVAPTGSGQNSPLVLSKNEIWHQVELINRTQLPWTTGAAMLMQGYQPLAQELLTYTPSGGRVQVPVTVSVDTRGTYTEKETGRTLKALRWSGYDYARIEMEGTVSVTNSKKIPAEVHIHCRMGGLVSEASHDGQIETNAFDRSDWTDYSGHPAVNNSSTVHWTLTVKPGETVTTNVKYHYFLRH